MKSTGPLNKIASSTIKECLPKGQARRPPHAASPVCYARTVRVRSEAGGWRMINYNN